MALFGGQVLISLIALVFFNKLASKFSLANYILSNRLVAYFLPSNDELRKEAGISSNKKKGKKKKEEKELKKQTDFRISKKLDFPIYAEKINSQVLTSIPFYAEYQWIVDFSFFSLIVYFISEIYFYYFNKSTEMNISLIWCFLASFFVVKVLYDLTCLYFGGGEKVIGERNMCLCLGSFYYLISMIILIVSEEFLEFGLEKGYEHFFENAGKLLEALGLSFAEARPISKLMFKFWLATWSGIISIVYTFPCLRMSQMQTDALNMKKQKPFFKLILHISYFFPIFLLHLWIKPLGRTLFTEINLFNNQPLMLTKNFELMRFTAIIIFIFLRLILMVTYMQAFLNLVLVKISALKKQSGTIRNIDLQKIISSIFNYSCIVAIQYIAPLINLLFLTILFKTLGKHNILESNMPSNESLNLDNIFIWKNLSYVFDSTFFNGLLSYMTWWSIFVMTSNNLLGLVYNKYFVD